MRFLSAGSTAAALLVGSVLAAAFLPSAQAGKLAEPIVGYWNYGGGVVQVKGGPTSFVGVVVKATRFEVCDHPVGEVMWSITKQGTTFSGTHPWMYSDCRSAGRGRASWSVEERNDKLVLHFCTTSPVDGRTVCQDLTRAKAVKPPSKPPPDQSWEQLSLTYEVPARFGVKKANGLVDYLTTSVELDPDYWTVVITVRRAGGKPCDPEAKYSWRIGGHRNAFEKVGACEFAFKKFPRLGDFRVNLITTNGNKKGVGEVWVALDDFLIVGLGDSNGSGEGNPDIPGMANPLWQDFRCDRSARSYQALAALTLENASKQSSVSFMHLACSGAAIFEGLLRHYRGINDPGGVALPAQVTWMDTLRGKRKPDAVILSIGINDLGFGPMVAFCIEQNGCFARTGFDPKHRGWDLDEVIDERLKTLVKSYDAVAARFSALGVDASKIYITEYPDPTHDSNLTFCNPLISVVGHGSFTRTEVEWAYEHVLLPLNATVAAAAARHGWNLVKGSQQLFRRHGYCSDDPWIVQLTESLLTQGVFWKGAGAAKAGTLHANAEGHRIQSRLVVTALKRNKITGQPR